MLAHGNVPHQHLKMGHVGQLCMTWCARYTEMLVEFGGETDEEAVNGH